MIPRRVLVLGATGFVGKALMQRLGERCTLEGHGAGRSGAGPSQPRAFVRVDISRREDLERAMAMVRPQVVINASSYGVQPDQRALEPSIAVNVTGAGLVVEAAAAAGCTRVLHLGSCSEYGAREGHIDESAPVAPVDLYGTTKAAGSLLALERGQHFGVAVTVLRLFNVWGEHEPAHRLFPAVWNACRSNAPLALTDGLQIKDYSYVGDIADCLLDLAELDPSPDAAVLNLASGVALPVREFALRVATRLGRPELLRFGALDNRAQEARHQIPDVSRLDTLLPGRRLTPIEAVLDRLRAAAGLAGGVGAHG